MDKVYKRDQSLTFAKDSYQRAIKQKFTDFTEARTKQVNKVFLQQMHNPQPVPLNAAQPPIQLQGMLPIQNPVQVPQGFSNHQLQHQMRAAGMGMPASVLPQQSMLPMGHPQMNLHQMQQKVHPQLLQNNGQPSLTPEENGMVNRSVLSMMQRTSEEQLNALRNLFPPEQRRIFQARGVDPAAFYFRNDAITKFLENKAKSANERTPIPPSNNALKPQQLRPPSQNTVPTLGHQSSGQIFEPSFGAGSINQILGQQREAMRSQEAGQVVVPASTGQIMPDAQRANIRTAPQQQPNVPLEGNLPSNQPSNAQYWPQNQNLQQSPHMRLSQQALQFVHMPHGGLHSQQRMVPQTTSLPNLNQATSPKSHNAWPPQKPSPMPQSQDKELASPQQITQQPAAIPFKQSNAVQNRQSLANMTANTAPNTSTSVNEEQKVSIPRQLQQQRLVARQQQQNEFLTKGSQPENVDGKKVQGATQTGQPSHLISNNTVANSNGVQQAAAAQQPTPSIPGQAHQLAPQERASMYTLNEEETHFMDSRNFPPQILNISSGQYLSKLPPDVKTWGQLKSWAVQNEHVLPPVTIHKLRNLQGMHYKNLMDPSNISKWKAQQMSLTQPMNTQGFPQPSAPTASMVPQQNHGPSLPVVNPPHPPASVAQPIPRPVVTVQEIQVFRAQFSERFNNLNDAQIEKILLKQKQDQARNHQRPTQQTSQLNNNARNPNQQNLQRQFPLSVNQTSISQSQNPQRSQPDQKSRLSATTTPSSKQIETNRQVQQFPGHGITKGVKRSSDNDIIEVAAGKDTLTNSQTSTEPRHNPSPNIQENSTGIYDRQRHLQAEHQRAVPAHTVHPDTKGSSFDQHRAQAQKRERDGRFVQISEEIKQNMHRRQPVQMDAHTKSLADRQLNAAKEYCHQVEHTLPKFFTMTGDEGFVKRVIRAVCFIYILCG